MTLLIQRVTVCLITLVWCWTKYNQYDDYSIWIFGVLISLIDWLAYEYGKQVGVHMVVTLPAVHRERIIREYDASQQTKNSNQDSDKGDSE